MFDIGFSELLLIAVVALVVLGPERPLLLSRDDKERIAYHEGGHAILGLVAPGADPVNRVTIVPRGQALGVTYQRPDNDRYNYPEAYLRARIVGMLGGRAAEAAPICWRWCLSSRSSLPTSWHRFLP